MKYAFVRFVETWFEYIYLCANEHIRVGNVVSAPINNYTEYKPALVLRIEELEDSQVPCPKRRILTLDKIISEKDFEFDFDDVGFMQHKTDKKLVDEWHFDSENDFCKFYVSTFDGLITYQQDYVLTFELGDCEADDFFIEYTITSPALLDIKIAYAETILSLLYYGKITKDEFDKLVSRMS